ncbi:MAG: serine/threonine-protein kinase, partial [Frankia sp.]
MLAPLTNADPRVVGEYRLQGRLGAGGMGSVYLGFDSRGRPTAVKVIRSEWVEDAEFRARFRREVSAARRVRGRHVAQVRAADVDATNPWMATEYVDGVSLGAAVADRGRFEGASLVALASGLADALVAVHTAGVVHRDLKPSNILLAWDGPKIIDFGIARHDGATTGTGTGAFFGTVAWMAPEQLRGGRAGPAADVFAWGMCITFSALGRHPFPAESAAATAIRVLNDPPDITGVPESIAPLVLRSLEKDPDRRPTASELFGALTGDQVSDVAGATGVSDVAGAAGVTGVAGVAAAADAADIAGITAAVDIEEPAQGVVTSRWVTPTSPPPAPSPDAELPTAAAFPAADAVRAAEAVPAEPASAPTSGQVRSGFPEAAGVPPGHGRRRRSGRRLRGRWIAVAAAAASVLGVVAVGLAASLPNARSRAGGSN